MEVWIAPTFDDVNRSGEILMSFILHDMLQWPSIPCICRHSQRIPMYNLSQIGLLEACWLAVVVIYLMGPAQ